MHVEVLIEDSSSQRLIEHLMPKFVGPFGEPHSWKLHDYRGIGRIPTGLKATSDPSRRILLDQLPRVLRGYVQTPGIDAVVVVLDSDNRDCFNFLSELKSLAASCSASHLVMFRLAIEETEAWYLGDRNALLKAYPRARTRALDHYVQDSVCEPGNWSRKPFIRVAHAPSDRLAGRCRVRSSMNGRRELGRSSTPRPTSRLALPSFATDYGG